MLVRDFFRNFIRTPTQIIPLFGALVWFFSLWAMLIVWIAEHEPVDPTESGKITFISDIGARGLKPLFITACVITATSWVSSLIIERWFRNHGRLAPDMRRREKVLSTLSIIGGLASGSGQILLSIFDIKHHPHQHRGFLLLFTLGVSISAFFTVMEFAWLRDDFTARIHLRRSYVAKFILASALVVSAIVFGVTLDPAEDVSAVFEWGISFGFTFYVLTLWYDLRHASGGVQKGESNYTPVEMRGTQVI